ncbi:MAG TPA: phosphatase PAP2 family protein [Pseudonocardia sp.]|jgi:membrane-associated phospholipid phosphatase|nr:phosphatase PAP2 family protein [Pseudonocardia sp.]
MNINIQLLLAINAFARSTPWLQPLMLLYSTVAGFVVFSELMLAGWWLGRRRVDLAPVAAAIWTPIGMLLALAINQPISKVLAEPRPYLMYPDLWTTSVHSLAPGFPSDHAVLAGAVTASLFLVSRPLGWFSLLAAAVMAFSRVYVAEAYPFDVLVGLPLGAALSLIGFVVVRRVLIRLLRMADQTIFRSLVTATPRPPKPAPRPLVPEPALAGPAPARSAENQLAEVEGDA